MKGGQCGLVESGENILRVDEVARLVPWAEGTLNLEMVERTMVLIPRFESTVKPKRKFVSNKNCV